MLLLVTFRSVVDHLVPTTIPPIGSLTLSIIPLPHEMHQFCSDIQWSNTSETFCSKVRRLLRFDICIKKTCL